MRAVDSDFADLQILAFIAGNISLAGYPPTQMEICRRMGYAGVRAAQYRLDRIEERATAFRWRRAMRDAGMSA